MSDPVTNMEIEDVLSSIRRLVAEGDKAKQEKKKEFGSVQAEAEKFVLTPSLRISEEESSESDAPMTLEAPVGFAAVPASEEEELAEQSASLKDVFAGELQVKPEVEPVAEGDEEVAEPSELEPVLEPETSRASLEATIAALEAAVTGSEDEFEPDGSEMAPVSSWGNEVEEVVFDSRRNDTEEPAPMEPLALTPEQAVSPISIVEDAPEETAPDLAEEEAAPEPMEDDNAPEPEVAVAAAAAAVTTGRIFRVVPDTTPENEPEVDEPLETAVPQGTAAMYHGSEAFAEEDHGDDLMEDEGELVAPDDDIDGLLADGATLDEELIRQVVAEVVKGELEGKLGETITRNVRRLVRREINRVLTHQELE